MLEHVAWLLSDARVDAGTLDWTALELDHAVVLRARLAERYARSTVNDHFSALLRWWC